MIAFERTFGNLTLSYKSLLLQCENVHCDKEGVCHFLIREAVQIGFRAFFETEIEPEL